MKKFFVCLFLCAGFLGCMDSENKKKSYAALSDVHKELADDCMKWADYTRGDPVIWGQDNPETRQTRIILNTDQGSFKRCDYDTKSGSRVKAEWISGGEVIQTFQK